MTRSTISVKRGVRLKKIAEGLAVAAFWLLAWQLAYDWIAQEILLVSPVQAVMRLFSLARELLFWRTVAQSCLRVLAGFAVALAVGTLLAALSIRFVLVRRLIAPMMGVVRATPVASFIILALVWMLTSRIPAFIACLVVMPIVWGNLVVGYDTIDRELLEMAQVFHLPRAKVLRYIYIPAELPHFASACSAGLGLAWKSGVAAEIIALPRYAIGRQINNAKIYLETADLFAWTIAVILLSILIEKLALLLLRRITGRLSGPPVLEMEGGSAHDPASTGAQ